MQTLWEINKSSSSPKVFLHWDPNVLEKRHKKLSNELLSYKRPIRSVPIRDNKRMKGTCNGSTGMSTADVHRFLPETYELPKIRGTDIRNRKSIRTNSSIEENFRSRLKDSKGSSAKRIVEGQAKMAETLRNLERCRTKIRRMRNDIQFPQINSVDGSWRCITPKTRERMYQFQSWHGSKLTSKSAI
ncbi:hypothetical protein SNEBB_010178 [Seison nebaliae]|nr:hypothetical protein SNEBB_010178 [Seison nebaliae]